MKHNKPKAHNPIRPYRPARRRPAARRSIDNLGGSQTFLFLRRLLGGSE